MDKDKVIIGEPVSGIVQSPDGDVQYFSTPEIKNKYNPYLHTTTLRDEESGQEYIEIACNGERINILVNNIEKAVRLEYNAIGVRILCLIDFIINIHIIVNTHYAMGFFIALISISGYFSTITYNRAGLIAYLSYQYIQSIYKIGLFILSIIAASLPAFRIELQKENLRVLNLTPQNLILLSILSCGQLYITYYVHCFYKMLKDVNYLRIK